MKLPSVMSLAEFWTTYTAMLRADHLINRFKFCPWSKAEKQLLLLAEAGPTGYRAVVYRTCSYSTRLR